MGSPGLRSELEEYLKQLNIETVCVDHPEDARGRRNEKAFGSYRILAMRVIPTVDHQREPYAVFTVEEMMPHVQHLKGAVTKNLFLKDKKKKGLWLVSARHDRQLNLNDLAKKLGAGSGNLRFAEESVMLEKLKVAQGCATALALFCDQEKSIKCVLDSDLVTGGHERVYFHPMTNAATMGLTPEDLLRFLRETGHEPILQSFD